ncbi:MAG: hypothetical protein E2P02_24200 [Acidobacteria bacterium]|nr:MAG: hypothetical protein E2P02_24200 [Acidobacteriota bacterium]
MKLSTWLTAALVSASVTLATDASAKAREDFEKVVPFSAGGQFSIKNDNGSITIKTWNEDSIRIEAEKTAKDQEGLKDIEIVVTGSGDSVSVETVHHRRRNRGGVSYTITLPVEANVDAETANGSVNVKGVHGHIKVRSVNGSLKLEDIAGDIEAKTTNGGIRARYTEATDGRHSFHTTNGSVRIYLPAGAGGELDAQTVNGSITTDFPTTVTRVSRRHLKGSFGGGGGASYEIETVNGSIKILEN